jgi:PIN domain nuclease of toxin-antitoxin system
MSDAILLDTHAAVWFASGQLEAQPTERIIAGGGEGQVFISPVTAWEIGLLARRPGHAPVRPVTDPTAWYHELLRSPHLRECAFTAVIAIGSTELPGTFHRDPADRFLVATARVLDCAIMTRDRKILAYAGQGHVKAIAC